MPRPNPANESVRAALCGGNSAKYGILISSIKSLESVAVAFSGGVDSTFLAYAAREALGEKALAITVDSPYIPRWEIREARELAQSIGIRHEIIVLKSIDDSIKDNPPDRCYLCKRVLFTAIQEKAHSLGYECVIDGSNFDDTKDYRPGLIALKELGVKSSLLEKKWSKAEIREASESVGLKTYDKPAYACLLTRIPYGTTIAQSDLRRVEQSEVFLMSRGFRAVRVRCHGDLARIEVARKDRKLLFNETLLDEISERLRGYGFKYVAFEAAGYRMGSLNQSVSS